MKTKKPVEVVRVRVETFWGKEWNGSYNAETTGRGCYVTVMEYEPVARERGPGFRGCPLGTGTTEEAAITDFVSRGRYEYQGKLPLTRDMVEVVRRDDRRTPRYGLFGFCGGVEKCLGKYATQTDARKAAQDGNLTADFTGIYVCELD